jgi:HIRAN domain
MVKKMDPRIGLTASDLKHPVAKEFLDLLDKTIQDGTISREELIQLKNWLFKNKDYEIPAVTFLWEKLTEIASDGKISKEDTKIFFDSILIVLPAKNRKVASNSRKEFELEQKELQKLKEETDRLNAFAELKKNFNSGPNLGDNLNSDSDFSTHQNQKGDCLEELDFLVAGTKYHQGNKNLVEGEKVFFVRDKTNKYDSNAIRILTEDKVMVGHMPAHLASKIAPMLDKGCQDDSYIKKILYNDVPVVVSKIYKVQSQNSQSKVTTKPSSQFDNKAVIKS